jgi:hypothetical protein
MFIGSENVLAWVAVEEIYAELWPIFAYRSAQYWVITVRSLVPSAPFKTVSPGR